MARIELKGYRTKSGNHFEGGASKIPVMFQEQKRINDEWLGPWGSKMAGGDSGLDGVASSVVKSISEDYRHYDIYFDDLDGMRLKSPMSWHLGMMAHDLVSRLSGYYQSVCAIHQHDDPEHNIFEIHLLISTPSQRENRQQDTIHELRILENYITVLMAQYSR